MVPTLGGVHKIQILIRDLLHEILQKVFGEEWGGQGDPDPLYEMRTFHAGSGFVSIFSRQIQQKIKTRKDERNPGSTVLRLYCLHAFLFDSGAVFARFVSRSKRGKPKKRPTVVPKHSN